MSDYLNYTFKLADAGLNVQFAPDLVPEGQWTRLENIKSTFEGFLETRPGLVEELNLGVSSEVHTIKRFDPSTLFVGAGTSFFRGSAPFSATFSGNPLGLVFYQPVDVPTPRAYIGDTTSMTKVRADGTVRKWGITGPTNAAGAVANGTGNLNSSGIDGGLKYEWFYTYGSTIDPNLESLPSPPMSSGLDLLNQQALVSISKSPDPQCDLIYLYRRGGSLAGTFRVKSFPNEDSQVSDNVADVNINLFKALRLDNYVPFTRVDENGTKYELSTPFIWGPFNGNIILACGLNQLDGFVAWTNPGRPDSADVVNLAEVTGSSEPLQNGFIYSSKPYVWSKDNLYALDYGTLDLGLGPQSFFTPRLTPVGRGISQPRAFCVGPLVWFLSGDAICETDTESPARPITDDALRPIFHGRATGGYQPIDFTKPASMVYQGVEVHFFYTDLAGTKRHLIYHIVQTRWRSAGTAGAVGYADEGQSAYRFLEGGVGKVFVSDPNATTDASGPIQVNARTGSIDFGLPTKLKEIGGIVVDADPGGGTITITPHLNAETGTDTVLSISGTGRQKFTLPIEDIYVYTFALDFAWTGRATIYQVGVLWRPDEEELRHWEFPETTLGLSGVSHARDAYIALRSTSEVTLTEEVVNPLGTLVGTYKIPSTGGKKKKVYVPWEPYKGVLYRIKLDSPTPFRLYGKDCEINVKEWNTEKGYTLVSPFKEVEG